MKKQEFYTQHGWKGSNYDSSLTTKDIAAIVRAYIKKAHSDYRFSVTSDRMSIDIILMEYPVELTNYELMKKHVEGIVRKDTTFYIPSLSAHRFSTKITEEQKEEHIQWRLQARAWHQLSSCDLDFYQWINPVILEVLKDINNFVASYNFDDSDAMIDYFDTNFYVHINIGKSGKPAKLVARTAKKAA